MGNKIIKDQHPHDSVPHDFVHNKPTRIIDRTCQGRTLESDCRGWVSLWESPEEADKCKWDRIMGNRIIKDQHPHDSVPRRFCPQQTDADKRRPCRADAAPRLGVLRLGFGSVVATAQGSGQANGTESWGHRIIKDAASA